MSDNLTTTTDHEKTETQTDAMEWYAVYCKSRHEKRVAEQLEEKGIDHYLPLRTEVRQWSDRKKKVSVPLFRSYIFVYIPKKMQIPVLESYGVVRFVKFRGELIPIPPEQIEAVKTIEKYGVNLQPESVDFELQDKVKVLAGPCKGLKGYLVHKHSEDRFLIEIDHMNLGASVVINKEWLTRLDNDEDEDEV